MCGIKVSYLTLIIILLASCIEPYEPSIKSSDEQILVVDAFVNLTDGTAAVKLTRTLPVYSPAPAPTESQAIVAIETEDGIQQRMTETSSGFYSQTGFSIDTEKKYRLHIRTQDGQEYYSSMVTFKNSPPIDSVYWLPEKDGIGIYVDTHDDSGNSRYYKWSYTETWEYLSAFNSSYTLKNGIISIRQPPEYINKCWKDDVSENILVGSSAHLQKDIISHAPLIFIEAGNQEILRTYSVLVRQQAIAKEAYEYWLQLRDITESLGGLFDPMPYQITGNIYNASDPSVPVLGYFTGGSTVEKRIFIRNSDLPENLRIFPRSACRLDSIPLEKMPLNGILIVESYGSPVIEGYLTSGPSCIDCTLQGGTTTKPSFWD